MHKSRFYGSYHRGTVGFSVRRNLDMTAVRRCDCSLLKGRGAIMLACPVDDIRVEKGAEYLVRYKWNAQVATYHLCSKYGIMTHYQRCTAPNICGINIACINEIEHRSFEDVPMNIDIDLSLVDEKRR